MFIASYRNTEAGVLRRTAAQVAQERQLAREARIRAEARAEALAEAAEQARIERLERAAKWEAMKREAILAAEAVQATKDYLGDEPVFVQHRTYEQIERSACRVFGVTKVDIRSGRRGRELVFARQFVMYWAARLTRLSYPQMGRKMGGRDHTTCLHGKSSYVEKRKEMGRTLKPARVSIQHPKGS